jgi:hypothetical protein
VPVGKLLHRTADGDELLAEWSAADEATVTAAAEIYRHWLSQDYEAVRSDGTYYEPATPDEFPVDAEQVILTTGLGGG